MMFGNKKRVVKGGWVGALTSLNQAKKENVCRTQNLVGVMEMVETRRLKWYGLYPMKRGWMSGVEVVTSVNPMKKGKPLHTRKIGGASGIGRGQPP